MASKVIRVSNLARTLRMVESMVEEIANEDGQRGAELVLTLIRKEYGIEENEKEDE